MGQAYFERVNRRLGAARFRRLRIRVDPSGRAALIVEHGYNQSDAVQELFRDAGFTVITSRRDLAGIPRVVGGRAG